MTTGDLKNNLRKLQFQLRAIKYDQEVDLESLGRGIPLTFLPIYHYAFIEYSHSLAKRILEMRWEMYSKTDLRFIETMYKVLRELFSYKPAITKEQFFSSGFGERKVIMCSDVLKLIRDMHKMLVGFKPVSVKNSNPNIKICSQNKFVTWKLGEPSSPSEVCVASSLAFAPQNESILSDQRQLLVNENSGQACTLVPSVINETISDPKSSVNEINEAKPQEQMNTESATNGSNYEQIHEEDFENPNAFDRLIRNRLMTLNETRLNSHQAVINSICEQLSYIGSKVTIFEDRLNKMDILLAHLSSDGDSINLTSSIASESCQSMHSLENVVARLTLVENRVNLLEKQSKPLVPPLKSLSLKKSENMNKELMEIAKPSTCVSRTNTISSSIPSPPMFNIRTESYVVEQLSESAVLQTKRIEAMLRETDELLMKNSQQSTTKVPEFLGSEENIDHL